METKKCEVCLNVLTIDQFTKCGRGYRKSCKMCQNGQKQIIEQPKQEIAKTDKYGNVEISDEDYKRAEESIQTIKNLIVEKCKVCRLSLEGLWDGAHDKCNVATEVSSAPVAEIKPSNESINISTNEQIQLVDNIADSEIKQKEPIRPYKFIRTDKADAEHCVAASENMNDPNLFITSVEHKKIGENDTYRSYVVYDNINLFTDHMFDLIGKKTPSYHEMIRGNLPHKIVFDFECFPIIENMPECVAPYPPAGHDADNEDTTEEMDNMVLEWQRKLMEYEAASSYEKRLRYLTQLIFDAIIRTFVDQYGICLRAEDLIIFDSSGISEYTHADGRKEKGMKFSRHYLIDNYYVTDFREAGAFANEVNKLMMSCLPRGILDMFYKPLYSLRTVGSCKLLEPHRVKNLIYAENPDEECRQYVTYIKGCEELEAHYASDLINDKKEAVIEADTIKILEMAESYTTDHVFRRRIGNTFTFNRRIGGICPVCDPKVHEHDNTAMVKIQENGVVLFICRRGKQNGKEPIPIGSIHGNIDANNANNEVANVAAEVQPNAGLGNLFNPNHRVYYKEHKAIENSADINTIRRFISNTVAYIENGGKAYYITKNPDVRDKSRIIWQIVSGNDLRNEKIKLNMFKKAYLFDKISDYRSKITYDFVDFIPYFRSENPYPDIFNMFTGYRYTFREDFGPDETKFDLITRHIRDIWCDGNQELYDYIINWFAHIIQKPAEKMGIAVLLRSSSQGAGKNIICEFIGKKVIGEQYTTVVNDLERIIGRFNSNLENKLLTIADEIQNYGGGFKSNDKLKSLITQTEIQIENKGVDVRTVKDYNNYMFLTNNDWALKIESSDRRYFVLDVNNKMANNSQYFSELGRQMESDDCSLHLFHYLAARDISKWNYRLIPSTKLKQEMKLNSVSAPLQYIIHLAQMEESPFWDSDGNWTTSIDALFNSFGKWSEEAKIQEKITKMMFSKELKKINIDSTKARIGGVSVRAYKLNRQTMTTDLLGHLKMASLDDII